MREMRINMGEEKALVLFLEKKWFYTSGRQRRLKHLPWAPHKPEGFDRVKRQRALSHRFPAKVMFMGLLLNLSLNSDLTGESF